MSANLAVWRAQMACHFGTVETIHKVGHHSGSRFSAGTVLADESRQRKDPMPRRRSPGTPSQLAIPAKHPCEQVITRNEKSLLQETVILGATLDRVDFEGANLRGSRFERVYLSGCDFRNANLLGVWFLDCDLMHANFSGASLGNNSFFGSCLSGAVGFTQPQRDYVVSSGGSFRRSKRLEGKLPPKRSPQPKQSHVD
jgi:hypothetical protein